MITRGRRAVPDLPRAAAIVRQKHKSRKPKLEKIVQIDLSTP
jgi:hypothetical protein